jgi:hypothetical protein
VTGIALVPLGWGLYVAKLLDAVDESTLDAIALVALLAALVPTVALALRRAPGAPAFLVLVAAPVAADALGKPPLAAAFVAGTAALAVCWLIARRRRVLRPSPDSAFLRGAGGAALLLLTPALVGLAALADVAGWVRVVATLGVLFGALACLSLAGRGWRLVAGFVAALATALLVLEALFVYDVYALLPVALAAGVGLAAAAAYFLAVSGGKAPAQARLIAVP